MKYLSVGTYPRYPTTQGGRIRLDAIHRILRSEGWETLHLWVGPANDGLSASERSKVGDDQTGIVFSGAFERLIREENGRLDIRANEFLRDDELAWQRFQNAIADFSPDVLAVEQAMLWPSIHRLFAENMSRNAIKLVYSSHNVEYLLLRDEAALQGAEIGEPDIGLLLEAEMALVAEADLVVTASQADANYFRPYARDVLCAPNGCWPRRRTAAKGRGALFVSSAHPHNVQGFVDYLGDSLDFLPHGETVTVVGNAADMLHAPCAAAVRSGRLILWGRVNEVELNRIIDAHAIILLPIGGGGGTNLKTVEALSTGKTILATTMAFRGFEDHIQSSQVYIADTPKAYQSRLGDLLRSPPEKNDDDDLLETCSPLWWNVCLSDLSPYLLKSNRYGWYPPNKSGGTVSLRAPLSSSQGWSRHEYGGQRMSRTTAEINLDLADFPVSPAGVRLFCSALADASHPVYLSIGINQEIVSRTCLEWPNFVEEISLNFISVGNSVKISLQCDRFWSEKDLGLSDSRLVHGVALRGIEFFI